MSSLDQPSERDDEQLDLRANRSSYIDDVKNIEPESDVEKADISWTLEWLENAVSVHKPHNMDTHLGVLCLVLSSDRKKAFMLHHKKAETWLPPGGHVDRNLTFREAAQNELSEELGKKLLLIGDKPFFLTRTVTRGKNAGHTDVTVWFAAEGNPSEHYVIQEKEAEAARWMGIEELQTLPQETHVPRAAAKLVNFLDKSRLAV